MVLHSNISVSVLDSTGTQYEIGIGGFGNTKSFIRSSKQGALLDDYQSTELDCNLPKVGEKNKGVEKSKSSFITPYAERSDHDDTPFILCRC